MIDRERFSRMLEESARLMLEEADALSEIDSKFGDGDHGITVTKIAKAIQQQVAAWNKGQPLKDFLEDLGMDVMAVRGGSAGPLYGTLVRPGRGACRQRDRRHGRRRAAHVRRAARPNCVT